MKMKSENLTNANANKLSLNYNINGVQEQLLNTSSSIHLKNLEIRIILIRYESFLECNYYSYLQLLICEEV